MANLMGILGGVGQGISAGVQDLERMEEAKNRKEEAQFRKELQQRERERLAEEKRLGEAVKGIQRSRITRTDGGSGVGGEENVFNPQGFTETPRSEAELLKEEAALYAASPDMRNRTLGRQLQGEARVLETQDKIKSVQSKYEEARKLLNTDPAKFQETYPALFNADKFGGPETAGMIMAPMSTAKGTVYNIMNPQGKTVAQLPMDKRSLGQALDAMYYSELANVDTKYAKLVMDQERLALERDGLGLKRQANETDAQFKARQADYYAGNLALNRDEFTAKQKSGYFAKAEPAFTPLGLSDDGTKILGRVGGKLMEQPVPAGYSKGLFPKVTGTSSPKRDETLKEWALVERDLMKSETKPEVIRQQQIQFYARRGVAPQEAEDVVMAGSRNGKPLTEKDVDDYNRRYPNSKVNKAELEWLKK